ncbi:MAG TPA: GNAT family N-acetyltransferase [Petrotogaceae bacterium]|jgi:GNAT superfamily N-acetyltransferase|nr:GNAT family N-acetyltransferase [Petrotogaceae bacterium]
MQIIIKEYEKGFSGYIKNIDRETFKECTKSDQQIDDTALNHGNKVFIAFYGEKAVGFISLLKAETLNYSGYWIDLIAVLPQFRGHSIAGMLIKKAYDYVKNKNCEILTALIRVNNISSRKAFEKESFAPSENDFKIYSKDISRGGKNAI